MNTIEEIEKLAKLRDRGVLTDEELKNLKATTLATEDNAPSTIENVNKDAIQTKSNLGIKMIRQKQHHRPRASA
jgi:hypothetical protein